MLNNEHPKKPKVIALMGVSGCGKTTVGKSLAQRIKGTFHDADDFHSRENKEKMRSGQPLSDLDRKGWLEDLSSAMAKWPTASVHVLACSALKQSYRDILAGSGVDIAFVLLNGSRDVIAERLAARTGHFMNIELLDSQFAILQEPERALSVDISKTVDEMVAEIIGAGI
ncbi:hypothetical protein BSKO_00962 [Bryopsis sp. KO-2023]|nr:hypothetical protein BSKO_00962 [Bryopsis sp. KO-2023]